MFDFMDADCDGKLTYQDFANICESTKTGTEY